MNANDVNKLESKIKELENQIEETKWKWEVEQEKKMDFDGISILEDTPLPKPKN